MYKQKLTVVTMLFIILSLSILTACQQKYPEAKMTADEVIDKVYVYGIPSFPIGKSPRPSGQWGAVYEGEGKWRIQGTIAIEELVIHYKSLPVEKGTLAEILHPNQSFYTATEYENEIVYYQTTWSFTGNEIILIKYEQ